MFDDIKGDCGAKDSVWLENILGFVRVELLLHQDAHLPFVQVLKNGGHYLEERVVVLEEGLIHVSSRKELVKRDYSSDIAEQTRMVVLRVKIAILVQ